MMILTILLATLSIWDYPARYPMHERLRNQFLVAMRGGDTISTMLGLGTTVMVIFSVIFLFYFLKSDWLHGFEQTQVRRGLFHRT